MSEEPSSEDRENEDPSDDLSDLGIGIHVITITYDNDPEIYPEVHLGDCSPWVAITLLKAAMESIELLIPPINVSYKGDTIVMHSNIDDIEGEE
jgi:hypothetical protein